MDLSQDNLRLFDRLLEEDSHRDRSFFDSLSPSDKQLALSILRELNDEGGNTPTLDLLWEVDYERRPVSVSEFITSKDYLGMEVISSIEDENRTAGVFETWYETLQELYRPDRSYSELILSCSIGTGKSAMSALAMAYKMYRLSCLRDPQKFYGMLPGHSIIFGVYTIFKYKAKELAGDYLRKAIESAPYFRDVFPLNTKLANDIRFPKSIAVSYGASSLHSIGMNVFSVAIDETDFMKAGASDEDKGQAFKLYTSTLRRMESRYMRGGEIPGIMIQISSKASAESYLSERIKSQAGIERTLVVEKTSWDVKPWRYTNKRFFVFSGDSYSDPRVLEDGEYDGLIDKTGVISIPEEHRQAFVEDIHGSLRDLANVGTGSSSPLIPRRDRIYNCIDPNRSHPFFKEQFHIGIDDDDAIEDFLDLDKLVTTRKGIFQPKVRAKVPRFIHLDLAISGDALGMSMGHVSGFKVVKKTDAQEPELVREFKVPEIYMDFTLRIIPTKGSKIRLSSVRDFIYALRAYGFAIAKVSADTFQSTDMLQQLGRSGITAEVLSVDIAREKSGHPYAFTREAIMEERVSYYDYPQLTAELANLQRIDVVSGGKVKWKVDHPSKMQDNKGNSVPGAKDVADSLCGVIYHCMMQDISDDAPAITPVDVMRGSLVKSTNPKAKPLSGLDWFVGDYS